jgi:predicted permease
MEQFARETPQRYPSSFRVQVQGLNEWVAKNLGGTLSLLFSAVTLMLLIGCGNVSILLLARGTARQQELAVRTAIGASQLRLVRQLLTESFGLSLCGSLAGVLLASQIIRLIVRWMPQDTFPSEAAIRINLPVLLFSIALSILTGLLFGLWPAFHLSRPDLAQVMQSGSRRTTGGAHSKRSHAILVAAQVALTLVLLTGAGETIASFRRLVHAELGYDPTHTISVGIPVHDNTHMAWEDRAQYFEQIRAKIAELPEVAGAGISTNATPPSNGFDTRFEIFGRSALQEQQARTNFVNAEYFTVLRIPLSAGRVWTPAETVRGSRLALVNQTFARQYWPKESPIGHQLRVPILKAQLPYSPAAPGSDDWLQIIGVVADARDDGLRKPIKPAIYVPYTTSMRMFTQILVRTRGEPQALLRAIRQEVRSIDTDQQIFGDPQDLEHWIMRQPEWSGERLATVLLSGFSLLALALAAFGLYSVVSHAVVRRTNEFGIRMAMGASAGSVLRLVFASTAASVGTGLASGMILSVILARMFAAWTQETTSDPLVLLAVSLLLSGTAAAACLFPARRASSIDPMAALRYE